MVKCWIRTPDAIQLASVISKNGDVFVTNDGKLDKIDEIKVLILSDLPE